MSNPFDPNSGRNESGAVGNNPADSGSSRLPSYEYEAGLNSQSAAEQPYGQQPYGQQPYGQQPYGQQPGGNFGYDNSSYAATQTTPAPGTFDAMDSISQAWKIFAERPGAWLLSALAYGVAFGLSFLVAYVIFFAYMIANTDEVTGEFTGDFSPAIIVGMVLLLLVGMVAMILWELVSYREAVYAVGGKKVTFKDFFTFKRCGIMFVVSLAVGLLSVLGVIALIIGAVVVSFLLMFAMTAAVPEGQTVGGAISSSFEVVKNNIVPSLVLFLLLAVINGIGGATYVGIIFTYPLTFLAMSHAYLTAKGLPVQRRS
ncbi:hypothetical protein [Corynebacterium epidermidicanis]|uniref:Integral membrane protein n=1 Tax=Corynebacterium epidermidicanis TaxID=1050174 RepID=A0A0G3GYD7_9CORY|nr:hypothetical protein [Corynebacterium epidermidicanis]AKK03867.1 hypothetical protein CEPID_10140 [Corynebacterium epidermidicanis]